MRYSSIAVPLVLSQIAVLVIEIFGIYLPIRQPVFSFASYFISMVCLFLVGVSIGMTDRIEP